MCEVKSNIMVSIKNSRGALGVQMLSSWSLFYYVRLITENLVSWEYSLKIQWHVKLT